jgi:hypothetical protein
LLLLLLCVFFFFFFFFPERNRSIDWQCSSARYRGVKVNKQTRLCGASSYCELLADDCDTNTCCCRYVSPDDFRRFYPDMPRRWGIRTAYECMGLDQRRPDIPPQARWGFLARHMHNMGTAFAHPQSYALAHELLVAAGVMRGRQQQERRRRSSCDDVDDSGGGGDSHNGDEDDKEEEEEDNYFVYTSNVDDCFVRSGRFDADRVYTPQGSWAFFQCRAPCRPDAVWPSRPMLDAVLPLVDRQTSGEMPADAVPRCRHCGGPTFGNVRGGQWFLHHGVYDAQQARMVAFVERALRRGRRLAVLEIGVGFNTPAVGRCVFWPRICHHGVFLWAAVLQR